MGSEKCKSTSHSSGPIFPLLDARRCLSIALLVGFFGWLPFCLIGCGGGRDETKQVSSIAGREELDSGSLQSDGRREALGPSLVISGEWCPEEKVWFLGTQRGDLLSLKSISDGKIEPIKSFHSAASFLEFEINQQRTLVSGLSSVDRALVWALSESSAIICDLGPQSTISWHPVEDLLATGDNSGAVSTWKVSNEGCSLVVHNNHQEGRISSLAWDSQGALLAAGSWDRTISVYGADLTQRARWIAHESLINALAWSPREDFLASAGSDGYVRVWEISPNSQLAEFVYGSTLRVSHLAWLNTENADYLAASGEDEYVRVWDVAEDQEIMSISMGSSVQGLAAGQGDVIFASTSDRKIFFADVGAKTKVWIHSESFQ